MPRLTEFKVLIFLAFLTHTWCIISTEVQILSHYEKKSNDHRENWRSDTLMRPLFDSEPEIVSASDFYLKEILKQVKAMNKKLDRAMIRLIGSTVKGDDNSGNRENLKFSNFTDPNCESLINSDVPSGVYHFSNKSTVTKEWLWNIFEIYCDQSAGGGWTVIQRRGESSSYSTLSRVNFSSRCWDDYAKGFGDLRGDFWLGNEWMHRLTTILGPYELRIEFENSLGEKFWAQYSKFQVGSREDNYRLKIGGKVVGNDTDLYNSQNSSVPTVNGPRVDYPHPDKPCTGSFNGIWWNHNNCFTVDLNSDHYKTTKMMIRSRNRSSQYVQGSEKNYR